MLRRSRGRPAHAADKLTARRNELAELIRRADRAHVTVGYRMDELLEARRLFEDVLDAPGMPRKAVREPLNDLTAVQDHHHQATAEYGQMRAPWDDAALAGSDLDTLTAGVKQFKRYLKDNASALKSLETLLRSLQETRSTMEDLRSRITLVRDRVLASFTAAEQELAWSNPMDPRHRPLAVRLHALGDALAALEAGRTELNRVRHIPDRYRDIDAKVMHLRDEIRVLRPWR
ncbi:hypothetical protein [Streptomyces caatingaensis]|uniref:Uncharacterized protein n=1 Tax=Streptomyces caatingaensis TaxID=1678637 RepID=A0A0K9XA82_9ACTN|nr:hypothetical protein [Streptomyces caatingaensis]KNB50113.1 hypothetical protein AC230_25785 [Streptomyces caatingaensis]